VVHDANARWLANHLGPELGEFGGIRCSAGIAQCPFAGWKHVAHAVDPHVESFVHVVGKSV
jgi:hypothetical protein